MSQHKRPLKQREAASSLSAAEAGAAGGLRQYPMLLLSDEEEEQLWAGSEAEEKEATPSCGRWALAVGSMLLLVGFISVYTLLIAESGRSVDSFKHYTYLFTSLTLQAELLKLLLSLLLYGGSRLLRITDTPLRLSLRKSIYLALPGLLSVCTSNLLFPILLRLQPTTFQLLSHAGILFAALFSCALLRRALDAIQWLSLIILTVGLSLTQLSCGSKLSLAGLLLTLLYAALDGFLYVYLELRLKEDEEDSLSAQNVHLFLYSSLGGGLLFLLLEGRRALEVGPFLGYDWRAAVIVGSLAGGGLLSSWITKMQSSVARMLCVSLSVLVLAVAASLFLDYSPSLLFGASLIIVLAAVLLYRHAQLSGLRFLLESEEYDAYDQARVEMLDSLPLWSAEDVQIVTSFDTDNSGEQLSVPPLSLQ